MNTMNKNPQFVDHQAVFARMRAEQQAERDRAERAEERTIERLRLDMTSLGQQFTGMSVICTFIASMIVALISLANDLYTTDGGTTDLNAYAWTRGQIYLMWYLALIYSLTTAIASGASAVFAFARASGSVDGDLQKRVTADRTRMEHLVRGFGVCLGIAVALLFAGLLFFVWAAHDRWIILLVGAAVMPLWAWLILQAYDEWRSVGKRRVAGEGRRWRLWGGIPWSSWSMSRWRREDTAKDKEAV